MSLRVPILDLVSSVKKDKAAMQRAFSRVLQGGRWILGPEVAALEKECSQVFDGRSVLGVNSGTDALILSLLALGIKAGDEVLVPAFTFAATAGAVAFIGAKPVMCDIEEGGFNLDPSEIIKRAGKKTKAVILVHLYGEPANMAAIISAAKKKKLKEIEDTAQAMGARNKSAACGAMGDAAAVSFYPTKNLGAMGDGGMVVCKEKKVFEKVKALRNHGQTAPYNSTMVGMNSRLDEIQAAILRLRLKQLNKWNAARRSNAKRYNQELASTPLGLPADTGMGVWHQYTLRVPQGKRDALKDHLLKAGIASAVYYPIPLHKQKAFSSKGSTALPRAEAAAKEALSLPIFPELGVRRQNLVIAAIKAFYKA